MLRRQALLRGASMLLPLVLVASACAGDDDDTSAGKGGKKKTDFTACEVTDTGGVDDRSFNENAYDGMKNAGKELGFKPSVLESKTEADYTTHINTLMGQGCDLIVTVGFLLGDATATAAKDNPKQNFAIVDFDFFDTKANKDISYPNVRELTFSTDQAAFLAGYVAASQTKTGKVGTYGGINIPTVTIFMKGFESGIDYYNNENSTNVKLVGWSTAKDDGLFTGDFEDKAKGRATTEQLLDAGADIIMPVAGPVGSGTIDAVKASDKKAKIIWVDTDGCVSVPDSCDLFLTSVMKNMDVAVHDTTVAAEKGTFEGGLYSGTLKNDGVAIAPFHKYENQVPKKVQDAVKELRQKIIDGDLKTMPGS